MNFSACCGRFCDGLSTECTPPKPISSKAQNAETSAPRPMSGLRGTEPLGGVRRCTPAQVERHVRDFRVRIVSRPRRDSRDAPNSGLAALP